MFTISQIPNLNRFRYKYWQTIFKNLFLNREKTFDKNNEEFHIFIKKTSVQKYLPTLI